jgi:menaquinone-dependent protoporphyrinogen IX oxidase
MTRRALVAYATKKGSTREVAEAIAARLGRDAAWTDEVAHHVSDLRVPV